MSRSLSQQAIFRLTDEFGLSRKKYVDEYGIKGRWWGDRCGCPDDRCMDGHHHDPHEECGCLTVLAGQLADKLRKAEWDMLRLAQVPNRVASR